jgi:lipoate-protein ligase B
VDARDLGVMEYGECLALQRAVHAAVARGDADDTVLIVEHPFVATLGRRGRREDVFDATLPVFEIERGGKATLHGPGQVVVYPIVHLGEGNRDVRAWVRHLEAFVKDLLGDWNIAAHTRVDAPGVWTDATERKIASIGVAVRDWVSLHGIAVNVELEPREFERLDPCGLGAAVMTNMRREGADVAMRDVRAWAVAHAADHFAAFNRDAPRVRAAATA